MSSLEPLGLAENAEGSLNSEGADRDVVLALDSGDDEVVSDSFTFLSVNSGNGDAAPATNPMMLMGSDEIIFDSQPQQAVINNVALQPALPPNRKGAATPHKLNVSGASIPGRRNKACSPAVTRARAAAKTPLKTPLKPLQLPGH